eukprot:Gregarina_sp_Poly_1__489@NODE_111_length_13906_cov_58_362887_g98_i0_p14_GENE_NODE_111_length_13906_cov_58_362887_g98_i0NODE_111_length_13906_cov_58_362887_g98_i0_p14_ORF_typecomplete_len117_score6_56SAP/PF02037_27/8_6e02SAP/PF02037_27/0_0048CALCOCO1/PF07888_11/0_005TraT/PF05818_12/1_2e03TraT/PF05818_12/0_021FtsL/PF04999_13/0_044_NODE_111_length_13906_cov_58_362887_g98_i050885438
MFWKICKTGKVYCKGQTSVSLGLSTSRTKKRSAASTKDPAQDSTQVDSTQIKVRDTQKENKCLCLRVQALSDSKRLNSLTVSQLQDALRSFGLRVMNDFRSIHYRLTENRKESGSD